MIFMIVINNFVFRLTLGWFRCVVARSSGKQNNPGGKSIQMSDKKVQEELTTACGINIIFTSQELGLELLFGAWVFLIS